MTEKMPAQFGTLGGSLLSIAITITDGDLIKSFLLGAIGTITSYGISRLLKVLFEKPSGERK
jgi:hypothetical protein